MGRVGVWMNVDFVDWVFGELLSMIFRYVGWCSGRDCRELRLENDQS